MSHQDWNPVVLKKSTKPPNNQSHISKKFQGTGVNRKKLDAGGDDNGYRPPVVTPDMGKTIQQARCAKKWTQKILAQKCNLPLSLVQQYEQGRGVYNRPNLDKICKALGVTIKKH